MKEIFHRTSVRKYTDVPVAPEHIEQMLRAAMAAPSACNQQPWEFYVTTQRETLDVLSACSPYAKMLRTAPLGFVVCSRTACRIPLYAQIDCAAATENLLLMADALGLGAVWIGIAPQEERMAAVREAIALPEHLTPFCLIACGHPAVEQQQQDRYDPSRVHTLP
jgi:nitroreductase